MYKAEILQRLKSEELNILKEVHRICVSNSLIYYMMGGTLLGAVRHKGFIPWDDDIDIILPRKDYERFLKICREEFLNSNLRVHDINSDPQYWLTFAKVEKKGTIFLEDGLKGNSVNQGIYIDIFALDNVPNVDGLYKRFVTFLIKRINGIIWSKQLKAITLNDRIKKFVSYPFSIKLLFSIAERLRNLFKEESCDYCINYASRYSAKKETYPKDVWGVPSLLEFEGEMFYAPSDSNFVLSQVFGGNYMELPPLEMRVTHKPYRIDFGDN